MRSRFDWRMVWHIYTWIFSIYLQYKGTNNSCQACLLEMIVVLDSATPSSNVISASVFECAGIISLACSSWVKSFIGFMVSASILSREDPFTTMVSFWRGSAARASKYWMSDWAIGTGSFCSRMSCWDCRMRRCTSRRLLSWGQRAGEKRLWLQLKVIVGERVALGVGFLRK